MPTKAWTVSSAWRFTASLLRSRERRRVGLPQERSAARCLPDSPSSCATDLRAEELVRPDGRRIPRSRRPRARKGRAARAAAAQQLAAALRAGLGQLRLELLEPAARSAAAETECNPVSEDLPTLLPQPIRRFRHLLTLAVVALLAVAVYIVVRDLIRGYWTTRGAPHRAHTLPQPVRARRPARDPRRAGEARQLDARAAPRTRRRAVRDAQPVAVRRAPRPRLACAGRPPPDGGDQQLLAQPRRRQVGLLWWLREIVPGGHGPRRDRRDLDGRLRRAPPRKLQETLLRGRRPLAGALVQRCEESAVGGLRRRRGLRGHDIVNHPPHYSAPVWVDVGTEDPFHNAASSTRTRSTPSCTSGRAGTTAATGTRTCASTLRSMPGTAPDPKIELHVHLEGTVRADTLREIGSGTTSAARRPRVALGSATSPTSSRPGSPPGAATAGTSARSSPATPPRWLAWAVYVEAIFSPAERVGGAPTGSRSSRATATAPWRRASCTASRCGSRRTSPRAPAERASRSPLLRKYRDRGVSEWVSAARGAVPAGAVRAGLRHREVARPGQRAARRRGRGPPRCAAPSRRCAPTGCATACAPWRIPAWWPSSRAAARFSTSPALEPPDGRGRFARATSAAAARRRRRALLDLDG